MGRAAIIETDCKPCKEFSEKIKPMGKMINTIAQNARIALCGTSPCEIVRYEYIEMTIVSESNVVE